MPIIPSVSICSPLYKFTGIKLFLLKKPSFNFSVSIKIPSLLSFINNSTNLNLGDKIPILFAILPEKNFSKLTGQYSAYLFLSKVSFFLVLIRQCFFSNIQFLGLSPLWRISIFFRFPSSKRK